MVFLSLAGPDEALTGTIVGSVADDHHITNAFTANASASVGPGGDFVLSLDPRPADLRGTNGTLTGSISGETLETTYADLTSALVTLRFTRSDAAAYNEARAAFEAAEMAALAATTPEPTIAVSDSCSRGLVGADMVAVAISAPGADASPACTDLKHVVFPDGASWGLPRDPATGYTSKTLVCIRGLDRLPALVYDTGGQYYAGILCSRLIALPNIGFTSDQDYSGPGLRVAMDGVAPGSPGARAGLKARDVIRAINGTPVYLLDDLWVILAQYGIGDRVTLTVERGDATLDLTVTLGRRSAG